MVNLVPAIIEIERLMQEAANEYEQKIKPYKDSLIQLRKINEACERCNGTGKVLRPRACAEDDRPDPNDPTDYITCFQCAGSGKARYNWSDTNVV